MKPKAGPRCCVCGESDRRALVVVALGGREGGEGSGVTLCGSHELMHRRSGSVASSEKELRELLRDRRGRRERRLEGDELGAALTAAFNAERRAAERRRAG
jgi:hypothetical protein